MQTGRMKIVLYVDGRWASTLHATELRNRLGVAAYAALLKSFDKLNLTEGAEPVTASAYPEQHDDPD